MPTPKIKSKAVLIGYNSDGRCVYSDIRDLSDYYDGDHVWDSGSKIKRLRLKKVRGFLFNSDGVLQQEFETSFDPTTGRIKASLARYSDGTVQRRRW
jgi:hypothetical protein